MIVSELIEKLQKMDKNLEVMLEGCDCNVTSEDVIIYKDYRYRKEPKLVVLVTSYKEIYDG